MASFGNLQIFQAQSAHGAALTTPTPSLCRASRRAFAAFRSARNSEICLWKLFYLDDPIGPHARHQRVLANQCATRLDRCHQHVKGANADPDRPAIGEQLAAMRQQEETPNAMPAGTSEAACIGRHYRAATENHRFFWEEPGKLTPQRRAISQVYTARFPRLHRSCCLAFTALGQTLVVAGSHPLCGRPCTIRTSGRRPF
jgi:hypothetical protein